MLNLETQQSTSTFSTKKVVAAVACTGCAVAAIALVGSSSKSTSSSLINIPQSMSGSVQRDDVNGKYNMNMKFNKFEDVEGNWILDAKITENWPERQHQKVTTVVNNVAVQELVHNGTRVQLDCLDMQVIPATNRIGEAFAGASVVRTDELSKDASEQMGACAPGSDKFTMTMFGINYIGCGQTNGEDVSMSVFRPTFNAKVEASANMNKHAIEHPAGSPSTCDAFNPQIGLFEANYPEDHARNLSGETEAWPFEEERDLERDAGMISANCLFVHGVGQTPYTSQFSSDAGYNDLTGYWGDSHKIGSRYDGVGCTDSHFAWHHSKNWGYNNTTYQSAICNMITYTSNYINIVITHSMGGMTSAQAFASQTCSRPSHVIYSQPPFYGSYGANFAYAMSRGGQISGYACYQAGNCKRRYNYPINYAALYYYYLWAGYTSLIQSSTGTNAKITFSGSPVNSRWKASSKLCGTTPVGIGSFGTNFGLWMLQGAAGNMQKQTVYYYKRECHWRGCGNVRKSMRVAFNDGMVDVDSCELGEEFNTPHRMPVNHEDGSCLNGNGSASNQRPCKKLSDMRVSAQQSMGRR